MKLIYRDKEANVLSTQFLHWEQDVVPIKGDRVKLPLYGGVTIIDRMHDTVAGEIILTCERYDDGDTDDAQ